MAIFDIILSDLICPRCNICGEFEIEAFFPSGNCFTYQVGDSIINITRNKMPPKGIYEGYAECPTCEKDFHLLVYVENCKIDSIEINQNKKGYIE